MLLKLLASLVFYNSFFKLLTNMPFVIKIIEKEHLKDFVIIFQTICIR